MSPLLPAIYGVWKIYRLLWLFCVSRDRYFGGGVPCNWLSWNFARWYTYVPHVSSPLLGAVPPRVPKSYVRPSVRSFVRLSATSLWTLYFENEWTDFNANWHKSFPGTRAWTVDLGGQEVKGQGHRRLKTEVIFRGLADSSFSAFEYNRLVHAFLRPGSTIAICCWPEHQSLLQQAAAGHECCSASCERHEEVRPRLDTPASLWAALARCGRSSHIQACGDGVQVLAWPGTGLSVWAVYIGRSSCWTTASSFPQPPSTRCSTVSARYVPSLSLDQRHGTCSKTICVSRTCKLTVFVVH